MSIVDAVGICRLGGFVGSNPEIIGSVPSLGQYYNESEQQEFLRKSLPNGVQPGSFTLDRLKDSLILSHVFKIKSSKEGVRDDLASITVVISEKKVNVGHFQELFKAIMNSFKGEIETLTPTLLMQTIERIYNGVNKNKKIKLDKVVIDIPKIVQEKKLTLVKGDITKLKGAFF
ncbi:MAG: hypothetical protein ACFFCS_17015 [Candidatus Hodarchaeota archaeon]